MDIPYLSTAEVVALSGLTERQVVYQRDRGLVMPASGVRGSGVPQRWSEHDALVLTAYGHLLRLGLKGDAAKRAVDGLRAFDASEFSGMALVREDGTVSRLLPYDRLDHGWVINLSDVRYRVRLLMPERDLVPA